MKRIFLIDGSALIFRSFHAFSGRAALTSRGRDVGMLFGFLSTLLMIIRREKPDRLAILFDTGAPTFRHKMFEQYKANRPPLLDAIRDQIPLLDEMLHAMKLPALRKEGWEADDLMGTLAVRAAKQAYEVYLVTGDKDFYQLVNDRISVYTLPFKGIGSPIVYDPEGVKTKFGVPPHQVIDVLALMGDTSDNVPGVPKVGPKTAVELINRFGTLEAVLQNAHQVPQPKLRENLSLFAEQARLSRELVIIDTDSPVDAQADDLNYGPLNNLQSRQLLVDYEFSGILNQLDQLEPAQVFMEAEMKDYQPVCTPDDLTRALGVLKTAEMLSIDVETTSIDPMRAELVGMSFSVRGEQGWYVAVNHFQGVPKDWRQPEPTRLRPDTPRELAFILEKLRPVYEDASVKKTGQNLKYDLLTLACYGIDVQGVAFDTMIASHLLDASARQHNLDQLAAQHLNYTKIPTNALIGSGSGQSSMAEVELEKITEYACEDSDIALRLTKLFQPRLEKDGLQRLLEELELPLIRVLMLMEMRGVKLDLQMLAEMSREFAAEIVTLEQEAQALAGVEFNLNSTQQLAEILFNRLRLPTGRKTKFGYSTDIDELERLRPLHRLPEVLLRYRHFAKLKSTYIDALPQMVHPITGRVHTSYSQTVAATGRLSSNDPNLQNIPIRSEEGGRIRRAFIAGEPGWRVVSADYSQIELRIMAHLSGDERLRSAFLKGADIHRETAAWMFDLHPELVDADMRRQAKEVNFGVLYGMGDFGLAQRLGIPRKRAREFIDQYFEKFSRVREYIDEIHLNAREKGYVETIMGRRRPIPDINSANYQVRMNAERIAINTPIQGSAADLIKTAMIRIQSELEGGRFKSKMLLQVHDELVFEAPPEELEPLAVMVKRVMAEALTLNVPVEVEVGWGESWLDAHD